MKMLKNSGIGLLFAFATMAAAGAQNPSVKLAEDEQLDPEQTHSQPLYNTFYRGRQSVRQQLNGEKQPINTISLRLLTEDGTVLYSEWGELSGRKQAHLVDGAVIQDGTYTLEILDGSGVTRRIITLRTPKPVPAPVRKLADVY
jgi:hypothetical protein